MEQSSLYYCEGNSDKVYHTQLEEKDGGYIVNFQYGRRGSTLTAGTKTATPVDYPKAKKIFEKLIAEKLAKGYSPGEAGSAFQGTSSEERVTGLRPQLLNPIELSRVEALLPDQSWGMQEKMDGERRMVRVNGTVLGSNRKGLAVALPVLIEKSLEQFVTPFAGEYVFDGEQIGDMYYVFDLLMADGQDLASQCYVARFARLSALTFGPNVKVVPLRLSGQDKRIAFAAIWARKGEGVVFKRLDAVYTPGCPASEGDQLKYKFTASATVFVLRVTEGKRSVAMGLLDAAGETVEVGNVTISANAAIPEPGALIEVQYLYAYPGGSLYQPIYKGIRSDQTREACTTAQLKYKAAAYVDEE